MRIPEFLRRALVRRLVERVPIRRAPDVIIGGEEHPYMLRWWIIPRNRWFNLYLHHFRRSDDDRALHDHPWCSMSVILDGPGYREHLPGGVVKLRPRGAVVVRGPRAAHRVELLPVPRSQRISATDPAERPVWTLFLTGPRLREWGFHCPQGWRHWREFTDASGSKVGRGCE